MIEQTLIKHIKRKREQVNNVKFQKNNFPLPSWIELNITDICNRKCSFCPQSHEFVPDNKFMNLEVARKISQDLQDANFDGVIAICGYGEPLLHKKIIQIVESLSPHKVEVITNGDYLNQDIVEKLESAGCSMILVSLYDGHHQIEKLKSLNSNIVDYRRRWFSEENDYGLILTNRSGALESYKKIDISSPCNYLMYSMFIDWNGDVLLCCQDWSRKVKFGNVNEKNLLDIWNSDEMNYYRKIHLNGRDVFPCKNCDSNGRIQGNNHRNVFLKLLQNDKF